MNQYYRYMVTLTEGGTEIRVEARDPKGDTINEPGGACHVARQLPHLRQLADKVKQASVRQNVLHELGEQLFDALFPAEVMGNFRDLLTKVMGEANTFLRLELDLDEAKLPQIAALPWEFLRAPQTSRHPADNLATHPRVVLSRRRPLWGRANPIELTEPLRIQLIVSAPNDGTLGPVAYMEVEQALHLLAQQHPDRMAAPLPTLHAPSLMSLEATLETSQPHIVHMIGHGRLRQTRGLHFGELALVQTTSGRADWKTDAEISEIFQVHNPAVVLLQACESSAVNSAGAFVGVASQIVQRNVPVVVGMQYPISNVAAVAFAEEFYSRLGQLQPVDVAVQRGRRLLNQKFATERAYATPVLFMRVEDGQLFVQSVAERQALSPNKSTQGGMNRVQLHEKINTYFTLSELQDLCFALSIDYENIPGETKTDKARGLITHFERHGDIAELVAACRQRRPGAHFGLAINKDKFNVPLPSPEVEEE